MASNAPDSVRGRGAASGDTLPPDRPSGDPSARAGDAPGPGVAIGDGIGERAPRSSGGRTSLRDHLHENFRSVVVGGLAGVLVLSVIVSAAAGSYITGRTRQTLVTQAKASLSELTSREASVRNDPFERIAMLARMLQRDEEAILAHPELHPAPNGAITLAVAPNGNAYKVEDNGGASVVLPQRAALDDEQRRLARETEAFDPLMQSTLAAMPETVVAVYFNGTRPLNRYVPFIPKVHEQFDPTLDARTFNFYYVADEAHDPEGVPKWTDAYLDPAGQGWMVTCAVPIRRGGKLVGVTGLDVTISKLLRSVVELPLPSDGSALLTSASGQILAMSPKLESVIGLKELAVHDYGGQPVRAETMKPEEFQVGRVADADVRAFFQRALATGGAGAAEEVRADGRDFVATHHVLNETGWRLFVFTPKETLMRPVDENRRRALATFGIFVAVVVGAGGLTVFALLRRSAKLAKAIAAPLKRLSEETAMLGTNLSPRTLEPVGIDEIDSLSTNFAQMAVELAERQQATMDAAIARNVQKRSEQLLLRVLPEPIVRRMMSGEQVIADAHGEVTVLFADIVGFTPFAAKLPPGEVVRVLEQLFVAFDAIAARFGVEKIKTVGDAYMAVAGVPHACEDHAARAARMALAMIAVLDRVDVGHRLAIRVGLHSGPAVAGVIGADKFLYDLWGDTVNIASRVESHGSPGRVHVTEETAALLREHFVLEERGFVELKGRGATKTSWLLAERDEPAPPTHRGG
jgi:class 3 adenylate cyclase